MTDMRRAYGVTEHLSGVRALRHPLTGLALILLAGGTPSAVLAMDPPGACTTCGQCHQIGPGAENGVGPVLNGVHGERVGSRSGFVYSRAMARAGQTGMVWTDAKLDAYLENPRRFVVGTNMAHGGMPDPEARADIIAYLRAFAD